MTIRVLNLCCEQSSASSSISHVHAAISQALKSSDFKCDHRVICNDLHADTPGFLSKPIDFKTLRRPRKHPVIVYRLKQAIKAYLAENQIDCVITDGLYSTELLFQIQKLNQPICTIFHGDTHLNRRHLPRLSKYAKDPPLDKNWQRIFVSEQAKTYFEKRHPYLKQDNRVIENCIDSKEIRAQLYSRQDARRLFDTDSNSFVLGALGRLSKEKNLETLLLSLPKLAKTEYQCVLIGDGKEKDKLQHTANTLGIRKRCNFMGYQAHGKQLLSGFDIFVMPSLTEGSPIALLEAMASGVDILCSDIDTLRSMQLPDECYFRCQNADSLAQRINQRFAEEDSEKSDRLEKIASIVDTRYSLKRFYSEYREAIQRICGT